MKKKKMEKVLEALINRAKELGYDNWLGQRLAEEQYVRQVEGQEEETDKVH